MGFNSFMFKKKRVFVTDKNGGENLFRYSEQLDNATYWLKTRAFTTANALDSPDGLRTAERLREDATATNSHILQQQVNITAGDYTMSFYVKSGERNWCRLGIDSKNVWFDVLNGVVGTQQAGVTGEIEFIGDGWYRIHGHWTALTAGLKTVTFGLSDQDNASTYSGNNTGGLYVWGAQMTTGLTIKPYQITLDTPVGATGNINPSAPTGGTVVDTKGIDTFTFTLNPSYTAAEHEYQINGGAITPCSSNVITVGDIYIPAGSLRVRVMAATGRNASIWLTNATDFTVQADAPTNLVVDDINNTATFTPSLGYLAEDHEYSINGGAFVQCTSNIIQVGEIAVAENNLIVRVMAVTGRSASPGLTNATAFTIPAGIYIDGTSGNDNNSGASPTSARKTFKDLNTKLAPGTTVYLKRGTVIDSRIKLAVDGTPSAPIKFDAYGTGALPTLRGNHEGTVWTLVPGYTDIYSSTFDGGGLKEVYEEDGVKGLRYKPAGRLDPSGQTLAQGLAAMATGEWGFSYASQPFKVFIKTPGGRVPGKMHCLELAIFEAYVDYVEFKNIKFSKVGSGLRIIGTGNKVTNCEFEDIMYNSVFLQDTDGAEVYNCKFTRCCETAIYHRRGKNGKYHWNLIQDLNGVFLGMEYVPTLGVERCGIGFESGHNNLAEYNTCLRVHGGITDMFYEHKTTARFNYGYDMIAASAVAGTNLKFYGNIMDCNQRSITFLDLVTKDVVVNGVVTKVKVNEYRTFDAKGINGTNHIWTGDPNQNPNVLQTPGKVFIFNNTVANYKTYGIWTGNLQVEWYNNLIVTKEANSSFCNFYTGTVAKNNCYYNSGGGGKWASGTGTSRPSTTSLATWQQTHDQGSIQGNPNLTNMVNPTLPAHYKPLAGSICINAGIDLATTGALASGYLDWDGKVKQGANYDIGPFEF